jgi:hypothetical protein
MRADGSMAGLYQSWIGDVMDAGTATLPDIVGYRDEQP